jgi:hypothetical protein
MFQARFLSQEFVLLSDIRRRAVFESLLTGHGCGLFVGVDGVSKLHTKIDIESVVLYRVQVFLLGNNGRYTPRFVVMMLRCGGIHITNVHGSSSCCVMRGLCILFYLEKGKCLGRPSLMCVDECVTMMDMQGVPV